MINLIFFLAVKALYGTVEPGEGSGWHIRALLSLIKALLSLEQISVEPGGCGGGEEALLEKKKNKKRKKKRTARVLMALIPCRETNPSRGDVYIEDKD